MPSRLELLFDKSPLPMWVYDVGTLGFLEVNAAATLQYGYSRDEFLAMRITDIRPPEDVVDVEKNVSSAARDAGSEGRRDRQPWQHRLKDGTTREVEISAQSLTFEGRRASLVVVIDVTELKQAQRTLAQYTERLSILHEIDRAIIASEDLVVIAERAMRPLRDLLGVPRAIINLFDFEANEAEWLVAIGRQRVHAGPGVRFPMAFMGDVDGLRRGELQTLSTVHLPAGPEVAALVGSGVYEYMVVPMIANGELLGGLSFGGAPGHFSDEQIVMAREVAAQIAIAIAQSRLRERVLRDTEQLEERVRQRTHDLNDSNARLESEVAERRRAETAAAHANRLKSEFLATMSHELRTPLNAIIGFAEVLKDDLVGELSEQQREYVGDILDSGEHLLQLINDILDLSKVEAGKMDLDLDAVDLKPLFGNSLAMVKEKALAQRIELVADVDASLDSAWLDARKVKQIVYNLLSNAVKFTPSGGTVVLRVAPVEQDGWWLAVSVTDTGIGISVADQARLFQPFVQIDGSLAKQFEGTGLGLAMVKRLTELQGGSVSLDSAPGKGSTFTVLLPLRQSRADGSAAPLARRAEESPHLAVIVEPDDGAADALRIELETAGLRTIRARDLDDGLAAATGHAPDIVLCSASLHSDACRQFVARVKGDPALASTSVVLLTEATAANEATGRDDVPTRPDVRAALAALALRPETARQLTALVVDDEPRVAEVFDAYLQTAGLRVIRVINGADVLARACAEHPDVIVLDLVMPAVSGFDVIEMIRAVPATRNIPIVVITAKSLTSQDRSALAGQVHDVVSKTGFKRNDFVRAVVRAAASADKA